MKLEKFIVLKKLRCLEGKDEFVWEFVKFVE